MGDPPLTAACQLFYTCLFAVVSLFREQYCSYICSLSKLCFLLPFLFLCLFCVLYFCHWRMARVETWHVVNPHGLYFKSKGLDLLNHFSVMQLTKKKSSQNCFLGLSSKDKEKKLSIYLMQLAGIEC